MSDAAPIEPLPFPVLVGDIGGTNARFALIAEKDAPVEVFAPVATAEYPDIEAAIEGGVFPHTRLRPRSAVIDGAGPITGDYIDLTNADWIIRPKDMIEKLGMEDAVLLNDFEAMALALPSLQPGDLEAIGGNASAGDGAEGGARPGHGARGGRARSGGRRLGAGARRRRPRLLRPGRAGRIRVLAEHREGARPDRSGDAALRKGSGEPLPGGGKDRRRHADADFSRRR